MTKWFLNGNVVEDLIPITKYRYEVEAQAALRRRCGRENEGGGQKGQDSVGVLEVDHTVGFRSVSDMGDKKTMSSKIEE